MVQIRNLEKNLQPKVKDMALEKPNKYNVLVVCGANKGRSASAHAYMQHIINETGIDWLEVDSGGIKDQDFYNTMSQRGEPGAPEEIETILHHYGVNEIDNHIAKPVTPEMLDKADLVLAYDRSVRDELINRLNDKGDANKISTIKGYLTGQEHIRDDWTLDTRDAQKFEGRFDKYMPHRKDDGSCDMAAIWRDNRNEQYTREQIITAFDHMTEEAMGLGKLVIDKMYQDIQETDNIKYL